MNGFYQDAVNIFETASRESGAASLNILLDDTGTVRIVAEPGWTPEALTAHYGAHTVYQVTRAAGQVRVEGKSGGSSCVLRGYNQHVCAAGLSSCLLPLR